MKHRYKRLIAYGCSFTAGAETVDHEYCHQQYRDNLDEIKRKGEVQDLKDERYFPKGAESIIVEEQKKYSYAAIIAKNLNLEYENWAIPGSSLQHAIFNFERDFVKNKFFDTDIVLFGITSPDRWFWLTDEGVSKSAIFGWENNWPAKELHDLFLYHLFNDYTILFDFFHSIKYIELLNRSSDFLVLQQFCHFNIPFYINNSNFKEEKNKNILISMLNNCKSFNSIVDFNFSFSKILNWSNDTHGLWHPKKHHHEIFANDLTTMITRKYL